MRGSTLIPWLFFAPLIGAMVFGAMAQFTGWGWAIWITQALLAVVIVVIITAFLPNFVWYWRRRRSRQSQSPDDPTFP